ncbi:alpha/beta hydrolase [Mycobacterium paragordonae]|uniref:Alpha/beta hydrolase n=1 Tax=Mycobacterium paragordonae TaxID=1389713 RepID=A0A386U8N8_9MYCO|nr:MULTISPECIES: alpha/beta hydrolase [Mycobacterium]AYE96934.1 alpha/beta hydrolase [Mycobacterium paragordonae]MDP7733768.1 alpha/beta hydrolase [Mycobacterium paragordonae]OBJ82480.1 carboxylesterase [Mycobacterium gordonae]TDK97592.1 alpha/beta hydrolase [Mycobacterium paragordonae]TDL00607.1 alpha/beta hydrolase [Mycobacterium paragordonae]
MCIASVTARCSQAGAEALRQGAQLAADARGISRAGAVLLRGSPFAVGWIAGWLATEFPPHVLTGHALSRVAPPSINRVGTTWAAQRADHALTAALETSFGSDFRDQVFHPTTNPALSVRRGILPKPKPGPHRRYAAKTSDISYGPGGTEHLLDIWRRPDLAPGHRAPVLIQVPGGAWSVNGKRPQAYTLMSRMVELGWICVSINYSKSPRAKFPAHIIDVKRAIAWVRENIGDYGGDSDFIAITGGSAGGHLASLAALTPNDPTFQPGFERADTTVQAAAPYYGVYDFTDFENMHEMMMPFLEHFVMKTRFADEPDRFTAASPISYVHRDAPPFFLLHGDRDQLAPIGQARAFCAALQGAGAPTVAYAELANAHHAFDITPTVRSRLAADAVSDFLGVVYGRRESALMGSFALSASPAS